jgi:hypothetical protein
MPSTIVKLCSSDARAWAHNQPLWVNESGEVARPVTRQEQQAISRALERSRSIQQSFRLSIPLLDVQHSGRSQHRARMPAVRALAPSLVPPAKLDCEFEVSIVGKERVVTVYSGKLRYSTGREVLAARLLADHGECVLHGRNGKCMAVLRDPLIAERVPVQGRRVQFSRNPGDEQAAVDLAASVASVNQRVKRSGKQGPIYSPDQCPNDCRGRRGGGEWAIAKGTTPPADDEHHPVCKFAPAWAATLSQTSTRAVLYDLELGVVAREAVESEVLEAQQARSLTGIGQVTVQGRLYAVLSSEEGDQASREAHGDTTPVATDVTGDPTLAPEPTDPAPLSADLGELPSAPTASPAPPIATRVFPLNAGQGALLTRAPPSSGKGNGGNVRERAHRQPASLPPAPSRPATPAERAEWPSLDDLRSEGPRTRAEVTARDYLARQPLARSS